MVCLSQSFISSCLASFGDLIMSARSDRHWPKLVQDTMQGFLRFNTTVFKASPALVRCAVERRPPTPLELRTLFESLGTTYIKLGQFIASSPSFFPADYVAEFQHCLDRTPNLPFEIIANIIESELGGALQQTFRSVNPEPIASASIAQVHAGILLDGREVVLKVQKPAVEQIINTDLNTAFLVARTLEIVSPVLTKSAITDIIEELHQSMIDECDFIKEANNLATFNAFITDNQIESVFAPRPIPAASTRRLLTMDRVYGQPITQLSNRDSSIKTLNQQALLNALHVWFLSLTQCSFFHGDLHSGNMLVEPNGRVAFIDFGMVGQIDASIWVAVLDLYRGISEADLDAIAGAMVSIGMTKRLVDRALLAEDLGAVFDLDVNLASVRLDSEGSLEKSAQRQLSALLSVATRHGIRFPSAFTLLLKQLLYFDRYLDLLAPGTDLFNGDFFDFGSLGLSDFDQTLGDAPIPKRPLS